MPKLRAKLRRVLGKKKQHSELGKQLVAPLQSPGVLRRVALQLDIGHFRGRQPITCVEIKFRAPHAIDAILSP